VKQGDFIEHFDGRRNFKYYSGLCSEDVIPACRCRVLVSKERLEQKWPTEKDGPDGEAFRKFAARLADAVQKVVAEGGVVEDASPGGEAYCPLGCLPEARQRVPFSDPISWRSMPASDQEIRDFYWAYEGGAPGPCGVTDSPYYRLGQAYRARFVTKGSQENV
jgi:hypothetical protein